MDGEMNINFFDLANGPDLNIFLVKPNDDCFSFFEEGNAYSRSYSLNIYRKNQLLYPSM